MMKRKLKAKQNISNPDVGFSLKGTRRNLGRIGSDSKNSSVRTIFRGAYPIGHGANLSSGYPIEILCNNAGNSTGSNCEQKSTLTNKGYIESHLVNNTDCQDKCIANWVKSFNPLEHSQGSYIRRIKIHRSGCENDSDQTFVECNPDHKETYYVGSIKKSRSSIHKDVNKGALTSGQYTEVELLRNNCLPDAACKSAFPFVLSRDGCMTEYYTAKQAIDAGLLPEDWMNCKTKYPTSHHWENPYL